MICAENTLIPWKWGRGISGDLDREPSHEEEVAVPGVRGLHGERITRESPPGEGAMPGWN